TVIKMLFHSLNLQFSPQDPRARDVEVMTEKINHLNKTVEQILSVARSAEPSLGSVDLNAVIEDLGLLVRHKLKNQAIKFSLDLESELPKVHADSAQLSQALLNLVLNSAEAMPNGGSLAIKTSSLAKDSAKAPSHALLELRDTGHGMSDEQQARAF